VANLLGIRLTEVEMTPESFWKLLPKVVASQDEPISDLASVPLYALSEIAAENVKVVLSGEGADETLFGYDFNMLLLKKNIAEFTKVHFPAKFQNLIPSRNLKLFLQSKEDNFLKFSKPYISEIFSVEEVGALFRDKSPHVVNSVVSRWYDTEDISDIRGIAKLYRTTWMVDDLLQRTDRVSMAHGLEVRAPFLDHVFVEWIDSLPLKLNLNAGFHVKNTKMLLRKYASASLPRKITEQQKKGFTIPSDSWLVYKPESNLNYFLMNDSSHIYNYISKQEVLGLIKNIGTPIANNSRIWNLLILEIWLRAHANK
jgi:asparagine synthase (glutamine-hydrolysing)